MRQLSAAPLRLVGVQMQHEQALWLIHLSVQYMSPAQLRGMLVESVAQSIGGRGPSAACFELSCL